MSPEYGFVCIDAAQRNDQFNPELKFSLYAFYDEILTVGFQYVLLHLRCRDVLEKMTNLERLAAGDGMSESISTAVFSSLKT